MYLTSCILKCRTDSKYPVYVIPLPFSALLQHQSANKLIADRSLLPYSKVIGYVALSVRETGREEDPA